MQGIKNDIAYLQRLVEKVNGGERNVKSISGMITRIQNQLKELDPNYIPHAALVLEFRKVVRNIREDRAEAIFEDIKIVTAKVNEGPNSNHLLVDLADEMDDIKSKIEKIDPQFAIRGELMVKYKEVEKNYIEKVVFDKMVHELIKEFRR
jgi:hypothetical protein